MKTIDKIRAYLKSISTTEEDYNKLLDKVWISPTRRNSECLHPEQETCARCPLNYFRRDNHETNRNNT